MHDIFPRATPVGDYFSISVLFCSLYGLSDEWHQIFVPEHNASLGDWLADTLGATVAATVFFRLTRCHPMIQRAVNQR